jgi:phage gp29-like protein
MAAAKSTRSAGARQKVTRNPAPDSRTRAAVDERLITPQIGHPSIWHQFNRIGGNLIPQRVSTIIAAADSGRPAQFVDLVHECRQKDGHLQAILEARELSLASLEWGLALPDDATPEEIEAAAALELALRQCATFPEMQAHQNGESLLFRYAWSEAIWRVGGGSVDKLLRGRLYPERFENLSCRRFGYRTSDGALLFDGSGHGNVDSGGVDLREDYPPGKFIGTTRRANGDVALREGLGRVLCWAALFRNWTLRDWLTLAELAWKPMRFGVFKKGQISKEDISALQSVLENLVTVGWAAVPDSVELKTEFPKGTERGATGSHQSLREHLAGDMSKAVLGGTLLTDAGTRGARSLGEVHERGLMDRRNADAVVSSATMNADIVAPFYDLNFGENIRRAVFFYHTEDTVDSKSLAETLKTLVEAGDRRIPVAWVHDQISIPVAADDEEVLGTNTTTSGDGEDDDTGDETGSDDGADPEDDSEE